jgi:2',3'-cyclic-nucleotide 2'-phosphodiesterase/3'-nucleotidase/5'-nucleotidase
MKHSFLLLALAGAAFAQDFTINKVGGYSTNLFNQAGAEIAAYDAGTKRLFFVNAQANVIEGLDVATPSRPRPLFRLFISSLYGAAVNSVAVGGGVIAAAVEASPRTDPGSVVFYDLNGNFLSAVRVGALPDMLIFTPDGKKLLVANEGEPNADYSVDPEGSVSIIDVSKGVANVTQADVRTADFKAFNTATLDPSVRIYGPRATVAQDVEPEYIAVAPDSKTAWVTLQENNAIGVVDIEQARITKIVGLGFKDHSLPGNGLDASDRDNRVNIANWPVFGIYQPDAIAAFQAKGKTWLITANEGDAREYTTFAEEARVSTLRLDPTKFPNAASLQQAGNLGRLTVTRSTGDTDGDGDFDALYVLGGRSFSIWDTDGKLVFDSGDQFEQITARLFPDNFNASNSNNNRDDRSDNKGPEPEGVTVAELNGRLYAFIGLERIGGVMVYDITNPEAPLYVAYTNSRDFRGNPEAGTAGDLGPEGVLALTAAESPNGKPMLITSNETSGSIALYEMNVPAPAVSVAARIVAQGRDSFAREMGLDGSTSTGVAPLTYQWRSTGPTAALFPAAANTPKVTVQFGQGQGAYTFELTVTDATGAKSSSTVTINYFGR